jgi:hypothetical protein
MNFDHGRKCVDLGKEAVERWRMNDSSDSRYLGYHLGMA